MNPSRRDVLKAGAGTAAASMLAGCLGAVGLGDDGPDADGYAAFFAIHDWAEHVGGEEMTFANPVGTGRMGHGWSPDADITPDIASTDIFFYLDTAEFSWAQNIAGNLRQDYENIRIVNLLEGMQPYMIPFDDSGEGLPEPDRGHDYPVEDIAFEEWDFFDLRSRSQLGYWHTGHWHGTLPDVVVGDSVPVGIVLKDNQERVVPLGAEETYRVDARVAGGDEDVVDIEVDGRVVEFEALALGSADIVFEFYRHGELVHDTAAEVTTIDVVEEVTDDGEFYDPHTWVDPVLAQRMVERIGDELADIDPENADVYRENAEAYTERLQGVDRRFEQLVEESELNEAVFAGHDSFQYLERRYDLELHTPVGISPDARASRGDIIGLIEVINERGIDTILYDPFEAPSPGGSFPQIVDSILEESEAEHAEPLTPVEGTTEMWEENGWGWVEQMEEVNLPSLEQALNPGTA